MKIMVADKLADEGIKKMKDAGHEVLAVWDEPKDKLPTLIKDCDAIIVRSATKVTKDLIAAGTKLKVIGRAGIGLDNVDAEAAKAKNIKVVNTPAATTISVAELAIGHMFSAARWIGAATASMKYGKWEKKSYEGTELSGKTLGVMGFGRIGRETGRIAKAIGMKVIAYDPFIKDKEVDGNKMVSKDDLVKQSDFISLHMPLTPETKDLLGAKEFEMCKKGVIIVNCSRGGTINEDALFLALQSGKVRAAGIDVFADEPPIGIHKLATLPNVSLTPHIGASTDEGQLRAGVQVAEVVMEALKK